MTYRGHVENGVVLVDDPVRLPEGAAVQVKLIEPVLATPVPQLDSNGPAIEVELAALWADVSASEWAQLPSDLTDNLDHYIYGTPKK